MLPISRQFRKRNARNSLDLFDLRRGKCRRHDDGPARRSDCITARASHGDVPTAPYSAPSGRGARAGRLANWRAVDDAARAA
jgi:hypothetical protein